MSAKIAVIYYSTYGHIKQLTEHVVAGAKATGAHVDVYQIPETLSAEILGKQHAIPRPDLPEITPVKLAEYDGFILGAPTRYGRVPAQVSAFFDSTGGLWAKGELVGKFASVYTSTASQHGGLETTALTTIPFFVHHGINYVPIGYAAPELTGLDSIIGGSAYGAGTVAAGDGSRQPTKEDFAVANHQGKHFATIVNTFVAGKHALANRNSTASGTTTAARAPPVTEAVPTTTVQPTAAVETKPYAVDAPTQANVPTTAAAVPAANAPTPTSTNPAVQNEKSAQKAKKPSIWARCCGNESDYAK